MVCAIDRVWRRAGLYFSAGVSQNAAAMEEKRTNVIIGLLVVLVLIGAVHTVDRFFAPKSEPKWEYASQKVADAEFVETMNRAGMNGWELVSARRASDAPLIQNPVYYYEMIFRRQMGPNRLPIKGP
jgi:hypothetical protein